MKLPARSTRLGLVLLLVGLTLLLTTRGPHPPAWKVIKSRGRSYRIGGGVLVRGDDLSPGESVRTLEELVLGVGSGARVRLHRNTSLRLGPFERPDQPAVLLHRAGSGRARAGSGSLRHGFPTGNSTTRDARVLLVQTSGILRWNLRRRRIVREESTRGYWRWDGETTPLNVPPGEWRVDSGSLRSRGREPRFTHPEGTSPGGVLMAPDSVLGALVRRVHTGSDMPVSLRAALGVWVRDRWGQIYLYRPGESCFRLRSPGPDETLFTGDDRAYQRCLSPTRSTSPDPRGLFGEESANQPH